MSSTPSSSSACSAAARFGIRQGCGRRASASSPGSATTPRPASIWSRPQGLAPVTNQTRIVDEELAESRRGGESGEADAGGIVSAGDGLTTISTDETGKLRVLTEPVVVGGTRIGTFRVADPLTSMDQALASLRNRFIAVGLGALLLSVAIAIWLANVISRPLRRMAAVASAVDSGDLSHRIDYEGDDEVGVLAEAFNHMLNRLEAGFRLQRDFVSDASHELRSPLTVLRGRIEQLADHAGDRQAVEAEANELMREVRRMERLSDDMLTLAKAERGGLGAAAPRPGRRLRRGSSSRSAPAWIPPLQRRVEPPWRSRS